MNRTSATARIRNDREASFAMAAGAAQQSAYDRVGRNALAHGPVRVYRPNPTLAQRVVRAIFAAL